MFAPMSSGGSDDVWHVQDEPASLKPGRFRAYLSNQLFSSNETASSSTTSPRSIPFPRTPVSSNDKGKSRARQDVFGPTHSDQDSPASTSFGDRFAAGLGLAKKKKRRAKPSALRNAPIQNDGRSAYDPLHPQSPPQVKGRTNFQRDSPRGSGERGSRVFSTSFSSARRFQGRDRDRDRYDPNRSWVMNLIRPSRETVEVWLDSWWKRWFALAVMPSLVVWFWCAVPFPKTDPYDPNLPWCNPGEDGRSDDPSNPPWCNPGKLSLRSSSMTAPSMLAYLPTVSQFVWAAAQRLFLSAQVEDHEPLSLVSSPNTTYPGTPDQEHLTVDANFWFFLIFYYGIYVAVALVYITQLFSLYRLNWWPAALGARTSYTFFWLLSLVAGWILHEMDPLGTENRHRKQVEDGHGHDKPKPTLVQAFSSNWQYNGTLPTHPGNGGGAIDENDIQWQRKTLWVGLAFATMAMPALVCLIGLRRSGRQTYRHSLTDHQKTFLERQLSRRIPSSYIRFLWFMTAIGLGLFALIAGQGYASVYLSTLPHTGLDGVAYVSFWTMTVNGLALVSHWILEEKVRSRALLFVFKYYYFLVYFIFYRNLFARLTSFDQFALVQLLSSFWVCIWYPFSMSGICHRITQYFNPEPKSWEEYVESVGLAFYLRNLAQNTTMLAFLGWVSILHFGSNQQLYPFFAYDNKHDPYNYQLTMLGSLAIWASELVSSFVARLICYFAFEVDVTNLGLDEMREFPEVLPTIGWGAVHTLMDMLLFLIKLNFR